MYIVGVLWIVSMFAYAIHQTYMNCKIARQVVQKSRDTFTAFSHYR